jgi:hypothetical protein
MTNEDKTISAPVAGYMVDAALEVAAINHEFDDMRWRVHRGEPGFMRIWKIKAATRKLRQALDMIEHCQGRAEQQKPAQLPKVVNT